MELSATTVAGRPKPQRVARETYACHRLTSSELSEKNLLQLFIITYNKLGMKAVRNIISFFHDLNNIHEAEHRKLQRCMVRI